MNRRPFRHPAAWYATDFDAKEALAIDLEPRHVDALARALGNGKSRELPMERMKAADFALDAIRDDVAAWREQVRTGRGIVLLRGFPVSDFGIEDIGRMYFGLGLHFGDPVSQSNMGDRLGHVVNIGGDDSRERAYRNARELHLHTDRCDHVGMLCVRPARKGGVSGYASALTVHNEILASRPELLEPLYAGYYLHRFGEQAPGEPPVTRERIPVFSIADGVPNVIYIRGYIDIAEQEGYSTLTAIERDALSYFEEVSNRAEVRLNFTLEPGELTLFNNCLVLHTRTAFEDDPDPDRARHLMRLWLMESDRPTVSGARAHKGAGGITPLPGKGTYYAARPQS